MKRNWNGKRKLNLACWLVKDETNLVRNHYTISFYLLLLCLFVSLFGGSWSTLLTQKVNRKWIFCSVTQNSSIGFLTFLSFSLVLLLVVLTCSNGTVIFFLCWLLFFVLCREKEKVTTTVVVVWCQEHNTTQTGLHCRVGALGI